LDFGYFEPRAKARKGIGLKYPIHFCIALCRMSQNDLPKVILDAAFRVHSALGPGLFEHVYEVIMAHELRKQNLEVARQVPIPIVYDGLEFEEGYRADLIVEPSVIVELKSVEALLPVHWKQLFTS